MKDDRMKPQGTRPGGSWMSEPEHICSGWVGFAHPPAASSFHQRMLVEGIFEMPFTWFAIFVGIYATLHGERSSFG